MLLCETLSKRAVPLMSRRVLHIPIGFAPLPIIHNFEGVSSRSALHMCSMPSAQDSIALYQSQHEQTLFHCLQGLQTRSCTWMHMRWQGCTAARSAALTATYSRSIPTSRMPSALHALFGLANLCMNDSPGMR